MGNDVGAEPCMALGSEGGPVEAYPGREVKLGDLSITRVLPVRDRRLEARGASSIGSARSPSPMPGRWTWRRIRTSGCRR